MKERISLCNNWDFCFGDLNSDSVLEKNDWQSVIIPHTWNNLDGQDGGNDYYRGSAWYRCHLNIDKDNEKEYWIEFLGVNSVSDVYVNGNHLGQHRGGYTLFRYNITEFLNSGENVLLVCADNSPFADVIPLTADFTFFGGIYREVNLVVVDKIHFALDDFGSEGVYFSYDNSPDIRKKADLNVSALISGNTDNCYIKTQIFVPNEFSECAGVEKTDFNVSDVISNSKCIAAEKITKNISSQINFTLQIDKPHLWNGRSDPFRYKAVCTLYKNDKEIDRVEKFIGFRYFSIHPRKGFFLNGNSYPLRGVNRHQDRKNMGWAISQKEHDEDFALIYEIGANAVRLAHYPHHPHFYDRCDQYGLLVWAEIPFVDNIGGLKLSDLPTDTVVNPSVTKSQLENAKQQLRELILQQYHRPSIFCWSMSNEVRQIYKKTAGDMLSELDALLHSLDKSRYSAIAVNHTYAHRWKSDIKGCNIYPGWYFGSQKQFRSQMMYHMRANHLKGVAASEYGAGANVYQHTENPVQPADTTCDFHPEEWASIVHENALEYFMSPKAKKVWGSFVWNMFDFAIDSRNEGSMPGMNDKGLVTYDRKIKKDPFFIYKSYWSKEPVVYITSRRFEVRTASKICVKVYSNSDKVTLSLNGKTLSTLHNCDNKQNHVFLFENVFLNIGENTVTASSGNISDTVVWKYYQQ
ncbi:MAG: glycoside hydrolase family 2 protein [Eubacterium sp.]